MVRGGCIPGRYERKPAFRPAVLDLRTYPPLDILTKVNRMSTAHSLEARALLLDHKIVEFAERLLRRHERGRNLDFQLWTLIFFELWWRTSFDSHRKAGAGTSRRPSDSAPIGLARGRQVA